MGTESNHIDATQQAAKFLGAAFSRPAFAGLGVRGLGAAVALSQLIARKFESSSQTVVPVSAAIDELSSRGLDRTEAERCLDSLTKRGVLKVVDGSLSIPLLCDHLTRIPAQLSDVLPAPKVVQSAPAVVKKTTSQRVKAVEGVRRLRLCDAGEPEGTPFVASLMTKDGGFVDVTQGYADKLAARYIGVDVLQELRKAEGWCETATSRKKTFVGMPAFLASWFTTAVMEARAAERASRAQRSKNAFGHGGYSEQPAVAVAAETATLDGLDDLVALAAPEPTPAPSAAPDSDPIQASIDFLGAPAAAAVPAVPAAPTGAPTANRLAAALAAKRAARGASAGHGAGKGAL